MLAARLGIQVLPIYLDGLFELKQAEKNARVPDK